MSKVLQEFLELRRASEARPTRCHLNGIDQTEGSSGRIAEPDEAGEISPLPGEATKPQFRYGTRDQAPWVAECPAGHVTDDVIETHEVLGWACEACERVYDPAECRLVPRGITAHDNAAPPDCAEGLE